MDNLKTDYFTQNLRERFPIPTEKKNTELMTFSKDWKQNEDAQDR